MTSILVLTVDVLQVRLLVRELCRHLNMQCVRASLISLFKLFVVFYHIVIGLLCGRMWLCYIWLLSQIENYNICYI